MRRNDNNSNIYMFYMATSVHFQPVDGKIGPIAKSISRDTFTYLRMYISKLRTVTSFLVSQLTLFHYPTLLVHSLQLALFSLRTESDNPDATCELMKLIPLVSLLTIWIFNLSAIHRWNNYYLRQRYQPSIIYLYRYFTYKDILFH